MHGLLPMPVPQWRRCLFLMQLFCIAPGSRSSPLAIAAFSHPHAAHVIGMDERSLGFYALGFAVGAAQGTPAVAIITSSGTAVSNLLPSVRERFPSFTPLLPVVAKWQPVELGQHGIPMLLLSFVSQQLARSSSQACLRVPLMAPWQVVEASQQGVPMLLLTADRPAELRHTAANQTIDQV